MSYHFKTIPSFEKDLRHLAKKYHSLKEDFLKLVDELKINPLLGVDLGHGVHKIRMAVKSKGTGKKGGLRVITHTDIFVNIKEGTIYFLSVYDKSNQATISDKEIKQLLKEIEL